VCSIDPFEQKIQLVLLIASTVAAVLAMVVPLLTLYWQLCSKISTLQEQFGTLGIDHQKTLLSLEQQIAELQRAKAVLIEKARHDSKKLRTIERRLRILETQLAHRTSAVGEHN
jgi:hypothetical protein